MSDLQGLKNLRRILIASCECLDEACKCEDTDRRNDLLSNIAGQLHKDHISKNCGNDLADAVDADIEPIREGIATITTTINTGDGSMTKVKIRQMDPQEVGCIMSSALEHVKSLLGGFTDKFGPIGTMVPGMEDDEVYDKAMDMSFSDIADKMKRKLIEIMGDDFSGQSSEAFDSPWFNMWNKEGYTPEGVEGIPEEVEAMNEPKMFPDKVLLTPPEIEGGFEWNAGVDSTLIRFAADLCVVSNMIKAASQDPQAVTKSQMLAMIDPSRYEDLDSELQDDLVELYSGVMADEFGIKEACSSVQKMQKRAYQIVSDPDYLNNNDRRLRDGSMPPNYEEWLRNVGESHHRAMSRLEEIHSPDNEVMKLRIPDGQRSNPIRKELAGIEVRMRRADLNSTEYNPKDSFEKRLDDNGPVAHRGTNDETTYEEKLDKSRGKSEVTGHPEQRLDKRRTDKKQKTTEASMEDAGLRKYDTFNQAVDSLLNDWRTEHKEMLKQANANNKIVPTSIVLCAPNLNDGQVTTDLMGAVEESDLMSADMGTVEKTGPGYQSIERMLQGRSIEQLLKELNGRIEDIEEKLIFQSNPDVPMPSIAQDTAVGSADVYMQSGPDQLITTPKPWNSFVEGHAETPIAPKPPQ